MRRGLELACQAMGIPSECVFTSEIKPHAVKVLLENNPGETITGDITQVNAEDIPDFDFLLGGFPCQAFSAAGKRLGFEDTRGTLFFDVARILKAKQPAGFLLENVEGLVTHDRANAKDPMGRTLRTILDTLDELGYYVEWKVLNAKHFGVPQERKRIYITGTKKHCPDLAGLGGETAKLSAILERGQPLADSPFVQRLLAHYPVEELEGKSIKDKRGGRDNIHSWDIGLKGEVTSEERELLSQLLKERRKKKWAEEYGIEWMDGMPLTLEQISSFYPSPHLRELLEHLVALGYLKKEHPKQKVGARRVPDANLPLGYNIVTGKMSLEVNKVLAKSGIAPTLVAMDMARLYVPDGTGNRQLTLREGLRLFGYPEDFKLNVEQSLGYDLLGNTVVVPVVQAVAQRVLAAIRGE